MAGIAAITVEGVLQQTVGDGPIGAGQALYEGLSNTFKIALITDQEPEKVNRWLALNGFDKHVYVVPKDVADPEDVSKRRVQQVARLKSYGGAVDLVFDPDPAVVEALFKQSVPAMLYLSPAYSRPEYRPGFKDEPTPWTDLVAEVERARELRAGDARPKQEAL